MLLGQRARHPLTAPIGVPEAASRAFGRRTLRLSFEHASAFMGGRTGDGEALLLDGESTELAARLRLPLGACTALETRLAALAHGGGVFDAAIESWHETFGLPNAGRETAPDDRLAFVHVGPDGERATLLSSAAGLGDARFALAWSPGCQGRDGDARAVLRAGVELPLGDESRWLGNGAPDVWADVQGPVPTLGARWPTRLAASVGLVAPGRGDALPEPEPLAAYGALGTRTALAPRWALGVTLDWHTALYDSALTELGDGAAQLGVGLEWRRPGLGTLGVSILEDLAVDTASDIALRLTLDLAP